MNEAGGEGTGERSTAKIVREGAVESLLEACAARFHGVWLACFFVSEGLGISVPREVAECGVGEEVSLCVASEQRAGGGGCIPLSGYPGLWIASHRGVVFCPPQRPFCG